MSFPIFSIPPKKCQKNVRRTKKKSEKMCKKCPGPRRIKNIWKTFFGHFLSSKMGRGVLRLRAVRAGTHFRSQKCPKNVFKMFFILQDIFFTFFCHLFWAAGHFFDIFFAVLEILEMTSFSHYFGIFELIQPISLGQPNTKANKPNCVEHLGDNKDPPVVRSKTDSMTPKSVKGLPVKSC